MDCTNWQVPREGTLESPCTVINFCFGSVIPTKTVKVYPNNKTYITKDIKEVIKKRKLTFKNNDTLEQKKRDKEMRGEIKAKDAHRHLEDPFKGNNPRKMWDTIKV